MSHGVVPNKMLTRVRAASERINLVLEHMAHSACVMTRGIAGWLPSWWPARQLAEPSASAQPDGAADCTSGANAMACAHPRLTEDFVDTGAQLPLASHCVV